MRLKNFFVNSPKELSYLLPLSPSSFPSSISLSGFVVAKEKKKKTNQLFFFAHRDDKEV
jgi:hypothetical protein